MGLIPKVKVGEFGLVDVGIVTASKIISERALLPIIGNSTVVSGAAKGALAFGIGAIGKGNKYSKMIATGIAVDAAEDILRGVNPFGLFGATGAQTTTETNDGAVRI